MADQVQVQDTTRNQHAANSGVNFNAGVVQSMAIDQEEGSVISTPETVKLKMDVPSANGLSSCTIELPWSYFARLRREETDKAISTTAAVATETLVKTLTPVRTAASKRKRNDDSGPSKHKRAKQLHSQFPGDGAPLRLTIRCREKDDRIRRLVVGKNKNLYGLLELFIRESGVPLRRIRLFYGDQLIDNGDTAEDFDLKDFSDLEIKIVAAN